MTGLGIESLVDMLVLSGLPEPEKEYRFAAPRKWRFDYAWADRKVALEYEGGTYSGGRHVRGKGYANDCRKYNEASLRGWTLIRVTAEMIGSGEAIRFIERALKEEISTVLDMQRRLQGGGKAVYGRRKKK